MTSSSRRSEPLDLERGLPTTPEDVAALRRIRAARRRLSTADYLRALSQLPPLPPEALRRRRRATGTQPFRLD